MQTQLKFLHKLPAARRRLHRPAHHAATGYIQHHREVEPALTRGNVGDVPDPDPVDSLDLLHRKATCRQIVGHRIRIRRVCGSTAPLATFGLQPVLAHPARDALPHTANPLRFQFLVYPRATITALTGPVNETNLHAESLISDITLFRAALMRRIKAGTTHTHVQRFREQHAVFVLHVVAKGEEPIPVGSQSFPLPAAWWGIVGMNNEHAWLAARAAAPNCIMQLHLVFEEMHFVAPPPPAVCPIPGCGGTQFRLHQQVTKPLRDPIHRSVTVSRYQCLRCGHTFRIYPHGVTHAHTSHCVQHMAVTLYLLGLSYGAVSAALDALRVYLCKSQVYAAVQSIQPHPARRCVFTAVFPWSPQTGMLRVQYKEHRLPLTLLADTCGGFALGVGTLPPGVLKELHDQIAPVVTALGGRVLLDGERGGHD